MALTYIVAPGDEVGPWVGIDLTLEVHVVPFLDVGHVQRRPKATGGLGWICGRGIGDQTRRNDGIRHRHRLGSWHTGRNMVIGLYYMPEKNTIPHGTNATERKRQ